MYEDLLKLQDSDVIWEMILEAYRNTNRPFSKTHGGRNKRRFGLAGCGLGLWAQAGAVGEAWFTCILFIYIVKSHLTRIRFRASGVPIPRNSHLTIQKITVMFPSQKITEYVSHSQDCHRFLRWPPQQKTACQNICYQAKSILPFEYRHTRRHNDCKTF